MSAYLQATQIVMSIAAAMAGFFITLDALESPMVPGTKKRILIGSGLMLVGSISLLGYFMSRW